jgi:8-hydroxy-5-deazaflavin:NADPH oxidoreductase
MQNKPTIAVIGGTGDLGSGFARLWAAAGYSVVLGSRAKDKAEAAARELASQIGIGVR